jgi:peptidoglycan hydrolase-like protein with peptidoglycan-binding domain
MLQQFLNNNGYPIAASGVGSKGLETDLFGKATEAALKRFQSAYRNIVIIPAGLTVPNGVVGPQTRKLLNTGAFAWIPTVGGKVTVVTTTTTQAMPKAQFTKQLSLGTVSPEVKALQQLLNAQGFTVAQSGIGSAGMENQSYGPATRAAVIRFQLKFGIVKSSADTGYGIVGPATRAKLNSLQK